MSRLKNFARGVFSSYVQMAANVVFTLASVPLALHYLSKEEFALWALVTQVVGYFALIDLGMAGSVARILADHKDDRDGGRYGAVFKAGAIVFTSQGVLIALATLLLAGPLATAFQIGPSLRADFIFLLRGHGLILAFVFATKIFGAPIWGFQRYDITNYCASVGFALQLAVLWLGFSAGWGVKSMLAGYVVASVLGSLWSLFAGIRLGFYPRRGAWGHIDGGTLREMFRFGRDLFLMAVGSQLLSASQIIIVTRLLGLDAAATWAICSKMFTLAQQLVGRIFESSGGALAEMFVRGEHDRLKSRFRDVTVLTASLSVAIGMVAAAVNPSFISVWTRGRVAWPPLVDTLLGTLLIVTCVSRCFTGIIGITKEIRLLRFVYFLEGFTFCVLAWFAGSSFGFAGIAAASIIATTMWSGLYGFTRALHQWHCPMGELFGWLGPAAKLLRLQLLITLPLHLLFSQAPGIWRLVLHLTVLPIISFSLLWKVGLPQTLRDEIILRVRANKYA